MQTPRRGGATITLAQSFFPLALVSDRTNVYWGDTDDQGVGRVVSVPIGGGAVATLAVTHELPQCIAADDTSVYWTNSVGDMALASDGALYWTTDLQVQWLMP